MKEMKQPSVIWICGEPNSGKTTLAQSLGKPFSLDGFVNNLSTWCPHTQICDLVNQYNDEELMSFFLDIEKHHLEEAFVDLLFDTEHGLPLTQELILMEGWLPELIERLVMAEFLTRQYRVWLTDRIEA